MLSDIAIAQAVRPRPISDVAGELGLAPDDLHPYGRYAAKLPLALSEQAPRGRLVLVTAISPTPAGEGKTTTSVALAQGLRRLGTNAVLCIRQPSLGPVFGVKGGAAGGGYSQVIPMEEINLHFTGDFHAIASAHALLSAMLDNSLQQGNPAGIDPRRITWPRTIDMNDRALRRAVIGLGGAGEGVPREERWVIVPASEVMAVLALATSRDDLRQRLGRIIVGSTADRRPVTADALGAAGAMALLLKDALRPNLVQTLEGGPALVHCGPFANIAHGCNSVIATRTALAVGDVVVTEAGFGSDLGAEKFFDIKSPAGALRPALAVVVATVRALKMNGGAAKATLASEDLGALERGLPNLEAHVANVRQFGVPVLVALNRFDADTPAELRLVREAAERAGARVVLNDGFAQGGAGAEDMARAVLQALGEGGGDFRPLVDPTRPIAEKIGTIVRRVYGGAGVQFTPRAERAITWLQDVGLGETPVCMAKTQYSLSDDPTRLGRPTDFTVTVKDVYPSAGAGFVVAQCGDIMTMPGLPPSPAALRMRLDDDGTITGLF